MISTHNPSAHMTLRKRIWRDRYLLLMLVPVGAFYLIFCYWPMYGILISFQKYNMFKGVFGSSWVGLANFRRIFSTSDFYMVLGNTLTLNLLSLAVGFPAPIILSLMLNELRSLRFKRVLQTIAYLPHFLSWVVIASIIAPLLSPTTGVVNKLIQYCGGEPIHFLGNARYWVPTYVFIGVWKEVGWSAIIYLAALTAIDSTLYEAAVIDGANRWKQTLHVTLPCIAPTITVLLILKLGSMMKIGFDQAYLLGNDSVSSVSRVISTYVYEIGMKRADYSRSTTIGIFQSAVNMVLLFAANLISRRVSGDSIY